MAVIDTTNVIDSAMYMKAKLKKNMVGDNYYIESLQHKVNNEWMYRYNVIDIEEENEKQKFYTKDKPVYTPTEAVIQKVVSDTGEKYADDWKKLVFQDSKHPTFHGKRFRFSLDFAKNVEYTEEEKEKKCSIWLGVNQDAMDPTSSIVVRRCNSNIVFAGSPTLSYDNITEYHYEPCALEVDFKYINIYMNNVVNINQAEIYAIMQYNYFTQNIRLNDRYVIGDVDLERRDLNSVFKVKAVQRLVSEGTFDVGTNLSLSNTSLILVALDRDVVSSEDDLEHRVTTQPTLYKVTDTPQPTPVEEEYFLKIQTECDGTILLNEEGIFTATLLNKEGEKISTEIYLDSYLTGTDKDNLYYQTTQKEDNVFVILNKRTYLKSNLKLTFSCVAPNNKECKQELAVRLGGNY